MIHVLISYALIAKKRSQKSSNSKLDKLKDKSKRKNINDPKNVTTVASSTAALAESLLAKNDKTCNVLITDDLVDDDHSMVALHPSKLGQLGLLSGDTVLLRGKKRKTTVAVVNEDRYVSETKIKLSKTARSNLR